MSEERKAAERLAAKAIGAIVLILFCIWAIPQIWDKLSPFIIAIPLAALLQPVIGFAERKLKMKRGLTTLICVLLVTALLIGFASWMISIIAEQAPEVLGQSGSMLSEALVTIQQATESLMASASDNYSPQVQQILENAMNDTLSRVSQLGTDLAAQLVSFTVNVATSLPYGIIYFSFLALGLYFITIHYNDIRSYLPGGKRRRQDSNTTQLTNSALRSLTGYLRVQGTFALMVFVVSLIALRCFGFRYYAALALLAGIMEMIPMVGSGLMYILMGVVFFLTGDMVSGIQVVALTGVLQLLRRLLEPKLMSNSIGITPLQSVIGMFVGMQIGGILGLIGGPVAMSVLVGAVRGNVFKSINEDLYLVTQWFKRRWARPESFKVFPDTNEEIRETELTKPKKTAQNQANRAGRYAKRKNRKPQG